MMMICCAKKKLLIQPISRIMWGKNMECQLSRYGKGRKKVFKLIRNKYP
jgi:hypothetical protein